MNNSLVLNDRILDFSYKLTDILSVFHGALMNPSRRSFEQLERKSVELADLTNYVILVLDREKFENNAKLGDITILYPLVNLIQKMREQSDMSGNTDFTSFSLQLSKFDQAVEHFSELIHAMKPYINDKGRRKFSHYLKNSS